MRFLWGLGFILVASTADALQAGFPGRMGPAAHAYYDADAKLLFASFATPPTVSRKLLINRAITGLKSAGIWSKLDSLQVYPAADSEAARHDWISPTRVATISGTVTFTVDRGFAGNGVDSNLNTNYTPSAGNFSALDNNFSTARVNADPVVELNGAIYGNSRFAIFPRTAGTTANFANSNSTGDTNSNPASVRWLATARDTSSSYSFYYASNTVVTALPFSRAGAATVGGMMWMGGRSGLSRPSAQQFSVFAAGSFLTAAQYQSFVDIMNAYMTGVGNTN